MDANLQSVLLDAAHNGQTLTYAELAARLGMRPPRTIHRTAMMLEELARAQADRGEPQLASFVVSRTRGGLPAPGFFMLMRELGLYDGPDTGRRARDFLDRERERCLRAWSAPEA